jgi:4-diphosphocytidyl-2-C-methyl-D-erythritol kinase
VLAREESGYHQIETLFCALDLADDIAIAPAPDGFSLEVVHEGTTAPDDLGPPEHNLAVRAAALFDQAAAPMGGLRIRLTKRVPAGAGLGGGSSDAAAVLRALHHMRPDAATADELLALGAQLGSDVPFFVSGAALALGWGRGERLLPLPPLPSAHVVLVIPPERVTTAEAYAALRLDHGVQPGVVEMPGRWRDIAAVSCNDFEPLVFSRHPRLGAIRGQPEDAGACVARMTGTGSVLFGIFEDEAAVAQAAAEIAARNADVATLITRTAGGPVAGA